MPFSSKTPHSLYMNPSFPIPTSLIFNPTSKIIIPLPNFFLYSSQSNSSFILQAWQLNPPFLILYLLSNHPLFVIIHSTLSFSPLASPALRYTPSSFTPPSIIPTYLMHYQWTPHFYVCHLIIMSVTRNTACPFFLIVYPSSLPLYPSQSLATLSYY